MCSGSTYPRVRLSEPGHCTWTWPTCASSEVTSATCLRRSTVPSTWLFSWTCSTTCRRRLPMRHWRRLPCAPPLCSRLAGCAFSPTTPSLRLTRTAVFHGVSIVPLLGRLASASFPNIGGRSTWFLCWQCRLARFPSNCRRHASTERCLKRDLFSRYPSFLEFAGRFSFSALMQLYFPRFVSVSKARSPCRRQRALRSAGLSSWRLSFCCCNRLAMSSNAPSRVARSSSSSSTSPAFWTRPPSSISCRVRARRSCTQSRVS